MIHRSTYLIAARACAIVFALSACGYLVVTAQRNANTPLTATTEAVVTPPPAAAQNGMFLQGSKSLVLDASDVVEVTESVSIEEPLVETDLAPIPVAIETAPAAGAEFLPSSKVGVIATPPPVFLPSSKSLRVEVQKPKPAPALPPKNP